MRDRSIRACYSKTLSFKPLDSMFGEVYKKKTKTKELSVYIYLVALPDSESECEV